MRGIAASFRAVDGTKYAIERDGIVTITTKVGDREVKYEDARVVGMDRSSSTVRVICKGGSVSSIPVNIIISVEDKRGASENSVTIRR